MPGRFAWEYKTYTLHKRPTVLPTNPRTTQAAEPRGKHDAYIPQVPHHPGPNFTMFSQFQSKFYFWHFFMALLVLKYVILTVVELHQYLYIKSPTVPAALNGFIAQSMYDTLRTVELGKFKLDFWESFISCTIYVLSIGFGLLPLAWSRLHAKLRDSRGGSLMKNVNFQSFAFYSLYMAIQYVLFKNLIYGPRQATFDEDFPFNYTLSQMKGVEHKITFVNIVSELFVFAFYTFLPNVSSLWLLLIGLICFFGLEILKLVIILEFILKTATPCPLAFTQAVRPLLDSVGFPPSHLKCLNMGPFTKNACTIGAGKFSYIIMGDQLLSMISPTEALAAVAHELGHWNNCHTLIKMSVHYIMTFIPFLFLVYFLQKPAFYRSFGIDLGLHSDKHLPLGIGLILARAIQSLILFLLFPCKNWISWLMEYQADAFAVKLGYRAALITILMKIVNFGSRLGTPFFGIFCSDHPVLPSRVAAIL